MNTFRTNCEKSDIVLTRLTPHQSSEKNTQTFRKILPLFKSHTEIKKTAKASNYDQSLLMLSNSLEQICRKSNNENINSSKDNIPISPSPLLQSSPSRPSSHNFKFPFKSNEKPANKSKTSKKNILCKQYSIEGIQIRVKHEETGDRLKEDLNKIISSSPNSIINEEHPMNMLRKKLTDAQEFLRTKFRLKIDTSKYPKDDARNFYLVVNKTRLIKVAHTLPDSSSKNIYVSSNAKASNPNNNVLLSHCNHSCILNSAFIHTDSLEELDDPVNIITVLHSSTIPSSVQLEKLLASFIDGPYIYIRPSRMVKTEYCNTKLLSIPILQVNENTLRFILSFRVPSEICVESIEVKRIDDQLNIKGKGHCVVDSGNELSLESSFKLRIELPEDSDGRSLIAYITSQRLLIVEGDLLSASRRMTCQF